MRYALFTPTMRRAALLAALTITTGMLAGCQTDGAPSNPISELAAYNAKKDEPAKPAEPPMTRARAATECWMRTEKGGASADLDKRADTVNKCIDEKMKTGEAPRS